MSILDKPKYKDPVTAEFGDDYDAYPVVACVWCKGPGNYRISHVLSLFDMVRRWLPVEHEFVCLTDHEDAFPRLFNLGIKPVIIKPDVPGWWQKAKMFEPSIWGKNRRVLFLDLDVVITGDLTKFFKAKHHTVAIANFGVNFQHSKYNSSVVLFTPAGPTKKIPQKFYEVGAQKVMDALHGDQCWFWRVMKDNVHTWPREWVQSYKYETRRTGLHPETSIVVYHGNPKPWECNDAVSKQYGAGAGTLAGQNGG